MFLLFIIITAGFHRWMVEDCVLLFY